MKCLRPLVLLCSFANFACQGTPPAAMANPAAPPAAEAQKPAEPTKPDEAKAKADAKKALQKELRGKQREQEAFAVEQQVAQLDRAVRQASIEASLAKTAADLAHARSELELFVKELRPRELEEKKMGLDQATYRAEHSKDEYGELEAMYQADEFARKTKELVLKRGRRDLEMAERYLAIQKREIAHFEGSQLPERERQLRQRIADAELERQKAETEASKSKLEFALADKKAKDRAADLAEEIAELQEKLAKETP